LEATKVHRSSAALVLVGPLDLSTSLSRSLCASLSASLTPRRSVCRCAVAQCAVIRLCSGSLNSRWQTM